jgi:murein DD-endopeptidase MepM/ murein hydrolase activator NlpD
VSLGQVIGYVGSTGNAGVPHLHIGYQPGGGPLTNPYQLMVKLCR